MSAQIRSFGWTTWIVVFVVVLLTLLAGLLYVAQ
jgi:hypothetical protein